MSIRTTITLDDDVRERVLLESRARGASFRDTLNELLRTALLKRPEQTRKRRFVVKATHMGYKTGINYDDISSLLEMGEGELHR